jgi:hypothetical protein
VQHIGGEQRNSKFGHHFLLVLYALNEIIEIHRTCNITYKQAVPWMFCGQACAAC